MNALIFSLNLHHHSYKNPPLGARDSQQQSHLHSPDSELRRSISVMASLIPSLVAVLTVLAVVNAQLPPDANSPQAFLTPHNAARSKVGVPALRWNANLATYALNYANLQKSKCIPLTHSRGPYGENLFWGSNGKAWTPNDAVTMWVNEGIDYKYSTNSCNPGKVCGHYTQVVWKTTTEVGCASVLCNDNAIYIICTYNPPGNYVGQRPY